MNSLRRMLLAASAAVMLGTTAMAADARANDREKSQADVRAKDREKSHADAEVAGEWELSVESQMGISNPHFSLQQQGTRITGTYKGMLGEAPVTGTVKGNEIVFSLQVNAQGMDLEVTYSGTVDGDGMQGIVKLGDFGEGKFTGKKAG